MRLTPTRRKKPPSFPSTEQFLLVTGLFSAPQRYSQREFCYASRDNSYFTFYPRMICLPFTVRVFSPISPLASSYFAAIRGLTIHRAEPATIFSDSSAF